MGNSQLRIDTNKEPSSKFDSLYRVRKSQGENKMKSAHYLTFQVGNQWYAIPVSMVIEVLQMVALDELPATDPNILGLLTLRNTVMPVIDLRRKFATSDTSLRLDTPLIAIRSNEQCFAFAVDVVDEVIDTSSLVWQQQHTDLYITHTIQLQGKLILILDVDQIQANSELI